MRFFRRHPRLDELSDFLADIAGESRARISTHLEGCQACRDSLQFLRRASLAAYEIPNDGPSSALLTRVLASRATGTRIILPTADAANRAPRRWLRPAIAATLLVVLAGALVTRHATEIEAGTTSGTLVFTPAMPQPGQSVAVSYRPAAMLSGQPWLALRARLRTTGDESYNAGIPTTTAMVLRPDAGGIFTGRFVLPDTVVYAAFAVEDSSARVIDDNASRNWELLVSDTAGNPRFEALDQRANDMMGRDWEEGFATARRMVKLYPANLRAWIWVNSFNSWLGRADDDRVRASQRSVLATFDSTFSSGTIPSQEQKGQMAWYAQSIDSSTATRWRARLLREAPENSFAIQWRLMAVIDSLRTRKDTARAFLRMDALWSDAPRDRQAQIASYGTSIALASGDTTLIRRWTTRLVRSERDKRSTARWVATQFASIPSLRKDGIRRLQDELDSLAELSPSERALDETASKQRDRHAATRRRLLASLGLALVATGDYSVGREALAEAAARGWSLDVFRAVRTANLAAGDTMSALTMAARIAVDPRTPSAFTDSVRSLANRILGANGWRSSIDSARSEYVKRMLVDASERSLSSGVRIRDLQGRRQSLAKLMNGRVTVVAFWSRFCGPAIDELPRLNAVAARLARDGVRVVSIVDEPNTSRELRTFLQEKHVTVPTYLDTWHESSRAFNQWGTPAYYVVDADGRIRFGVTNSADEVLARAEALKLSGAIIVEGSRQ